MLTAAEYEQLISEIAGGICQSAQELHGLKIGTGHKNRILGASGYSHQIDVSLHDSGRIFLIECKRWGKSIGVAEVLVLAGRARDIQVLSTECSVKAIIVSMRGASKGARLLAQQFDIAIEIAISASEFGLRIGRYVHQAMSEGVGLSASFELTVIKKGIIINE